jgi:hypothetical protein
VFSVFISVVIIGLLFVPAHAITLEEQRRAKVVIVNDTGKELAKITVYHKYSNEFKDEFSWENLKAGATSKPHDKPVRFYTGIATTGVDWWIVVFKDKAGNEYISNPKNFRKIVDALESILLDSVPMLSSILIGPSGVLIKDASEIAARAALNKEETFSKQFGVSFKQHVLRKADADTTIQIILKSHEDEGVIIQSVNGRKADTDYRLFTPEEKSIVDGITEKALEKLKKQFEDELKRRKEASQPAATDAPN